MTKGFQIRLRREASHSTWTILTVLTKLVNRNREWTSEADLAECRNYHGTPGLFDLARVHDIITLPFDSLLMPGKPNTNTRLRDRLAVNVINLVGGFCLSHFPGSWVTPQGLRTSLSTGPHMLHTSATLREIGADFPSLHFSVISGALSAIRVV